MIIDTRNPQINAQLCITGRTFQDKDGLRISWTYAGFMLNAAFTGKLSAVITSDGKGTWLTDPMQAVEPSFLRVVIDGDYENNTRIEIKRGTAAYAIAEGDGKPHKIEVYKTTEAVFSSFLFSSLSFEGELLPPPLHAPCRIEFIVIPSPAVPAF